MKKFITLALRNPYSFSRHLPFSFMRTTKYLLAACIISLSFALILQAAMGAVFVAMGYPNPADNYNKTFEMMISDFGPLLFFALGVVFAPLFEEFMFRYGLSLKKKHVGYGVVFFNYVFWTNLVEPVVFPYSDWIKIGMFVLCIYLYFAFVQQRHLDIIKRKYIIPFFYIVNLMFAMIHLSNFESLHWIYIPFYMGLISILIIPSFMFSIFRLRYGIWASVIAHGAWNTVAIGLYLLGL